MHLGREVDPLRASVSWQVGLSELPYEYLAARTPERDRVRKGLHVVDAGDSNLVTDSLRLDPPPPDDAGSLVPRVVPTDRRADPPAQQQPVDLVRKLGRRRREADAQRARLLLADIAICLEKTEHQIADNLGRDVRAEDHGRDLLLPGQLAPNARLSTEFEHAVLLTGPV